MKKDKNLKPYVYKRSVKRDPDKINKLKKYYEECNKNRANEIDDVINFMNSVTFDDILPSNNNKVKDNGK